MAIYLVNGDLTTADFQAADLNDLELAPQAVISTKDIISYQRSTHEIELQEEAYRRIQDLFELPVDVDGMPFVVSVNEERIYGGAFWTPASSLTFNGVIILQPFDSESTVIKLDLGYPGPGAAAGIDPRNDERIMEALDAAGKLR